MVAVFFRLGFLLRELFDRMTQCPEEYDPEVVLNNQVVRWRDLPPKQQDRLRLGGNVCLGYSSKVF